MTETSPLGSISRVPSELASASSDDQYAWRATQGRPAPMVEIRARSDAGLVAWDGATMGELEVRGPWVAAAYYPGDVAVDRWTEDGWFRTGDIVTIAPRGCVTIQDRAKDLVKSGGEWISTVALESALVGSRGRERSRRGRGAASAVGRAPAGCRSCRPRGVTPTIEDLRAHLAPHFAKWWLPDAVVCVERLPKTGTGKYQKHEVRAMFREHLSGAVSVVNHKDTSHRRRTEILLGSPKKKLCASPCLCVFVVD